MKKFIFRPWPLTFLMLLMIVLAGYFAGAFSGVNISPRPINVQTQQLKSYVDLIANICLAVGVIVGLYGGARVLVNMSKAQS